MSKNNVRLIILSMTASFVAGCSGTAPSVRPIVPVTAPTASSSTSAQGSTSVPLAGGPLVVNGAGYNVTFNLSPGSVFAPNTTATYVISTTPPAGFPVTASSATRKPQQTGKTGLLYVSMKVNNAGSVTPGPTVDVQFPSNAVLPASPSRLSLDVYDHSNPTAGVTRFGGTASYGPKANEVQFAQLDPKIVNSFVITSLLKDTQYDFVFDDNGDIVPPGTATPTPSASPAATAAPSATPVPSPTATATPAIPILGDIGNRTYYLDNPRATVVQLFQTPLTTPPVVIGAIPFFENNFRIDHAGNVVGLDHNLNVGYYQATRSASINLAVPEATGYHAGIVGLDPAGHLYTVDIGPQSSPLTVSEYQVSGNTTTLLSRATLPPETKSPYHSPVASADAYSLPLKIGKYPPLSTGNASAIGTVQPDNGGDFADFDVSPDGVIFVLNPNRVVGVSAYRASSGNAAVQHETLPSQYGGFYVRVRP